MTGFFTQEGLFRCEIRFTAADLDSRGRVDPCSLLWQLQEIAAAHYEALGLGAALVASHGCFWALTRTEAEILAPIPADAPLWLDTWSGRFGHGLYRRHYRLQTLSGDPIVRGVSVWVLMDKETRQLTADRSWMPDPVVISQPEELTGARRLRFPVPEASLERTVLPSETDQNGHLNNTVYYRWASDLLPGAFSAQYALRTLWVEYKKELPLGQTAQLEYSMSDRTLFLRGTAEGRESFLMRCEYDPI